jgi:hypothetical protein
MPEFRFNCLGRNARREPVLTRPVSVILSVNQWGRNQDQFSVGVTCPHNTGGHGHRCNASHPGTDKVGDGIPCAYAVDIPHSIDNVFRHES